MAFSLALLLAGCASRSPSSAPTTETDAKASRVVLLVSIDGLPASILGSGMLPTLDRVAAEGVRAEWMNASYPTLTFPNHYTLVTGLRPDRHSVIHNNMIDAHLGRFMQLSGGTFALETESATESGSLVSATVRFRAQREGHEDLDQHGVDVFRVADGRIAEVWLMSEDQEAEDRFWGTA